MNRVNTKEKLCTLCGHDCSSRRRMRDPKGRYYCATCYDNARSRRHERMTTAPPPAPARTPTSGRRLTRDEPWDFWHEFDFHEDQMLCPGCDAPHLPGAPVCTHCGFDARTGLRRKPVEANGPRHEAATDRSPEHAPLVATGALLIALFVVLLALLWQVAA